LRAQRRDIVRVGQTSGVKYQVCIEWDAMLEAEGDKAQGQRPMVGADDFADPLAQRIRGEVTGVEDDSNLVDGRHQFALLFD